MPLTIGSVVGYGLTVSASASLGFVANGILAGAKVQELHHRIDVIESLYQQQAVLLGDMANLLGQVTSSLSDPVLQNSVSRTLSSASRLPSHP